MGIVVTGLSIILQFCAATIALRIVIASRRLAMLPFAMAILLMGVRRSFSLYNKVAFERTLDVGAESIALLISVLMLTGLIGIQRWVVVGTFGNRPSELKTGISEVTGIAASRLALLLGVSAIAASCAIGYFAFCASRDAMREIIIQGHLSIAQSIAQHAELRPPSMSNSLMTKEIPELWQRIDQPFPNAYLCVVRADGELLLHTNSESARGANVGDLPIETGRASGPKTLRAMVVAGKDWAGDFTSGNGESQIAACAYVPHLKSMVIIHTPAEEIDAVVRASVLPWVGGLAFTVFLLIPLSLGLLFWAHSDSVQQRELATAALLESESRFKSYIEFAPHGLFVCDEKGNFIDVNPEAEKMTGYARTELLNMKFLEIVAEEDRSKALSFFKTVSTGGTFTFDLSFATKNGEPRVCTANAVGLPGNQSLGFATDITDRRRDEHMLRQRELDVIHAGQLSLVGEMAASIMHEIAQPLYAIGNYAIVCQRHIEQLGDRKMEKLSNSIGSISKNVGRTKDILAEMGNLSRRGDPVASVVMVNELLTDILRMLEFKIRERKVNVEFEPRSPIHVFANGVQIQQVFANLIRNACDAFEESDIDDARLIIDTEVRNKVCYISIEDNGPGLDPEMAEQIFESFFTTKRTGMGLGLAISRTIVETYGGRIWVNPHLDRGVAFHISLPLSREEKT